MKIQYKAPLIVFLVTLLLSGIAVYANFESNVKLMGDAMQTELRTVAVLANNLVTAEGKNTAAQAALVVHLTSVQEAMRKQDRQALANLLVPAYNVLFEKHHVVQGHFHIPPATSFLRLRNLDKYGDDLSGDREMVLKANKEERPFQGIEISSTGMNIRGMDVVKDEKGHIGTFESQVNFDSVLDDLKRIMGYDAAVFIDNQLMTEIAKLAKKPDPDQIIGGYRSIATMDWKKVKRVTTPDLLTSVNDVIYRIERLNGELVGLVAIPLLDFKGAQIGSIIATRSFQDYQTTLKDNLVKTVGFAFLQSLALSVILFVVLMVYYLRPIKYLDQVFQSLLKGDTLVDVSHLAKNEDEIGALARDAATLKKRVLKQKASQTAL